MKKTFIGSLLAYAVIFSGYVSADDNSALVKRGAYLALASDCLACHTAANGPAYGGGYPVSTPVGVIYGSNISSDKEYGIGNWTDEQFVRAVRQGLGKEGQQLYPAMPYDAFSKMRPDDVIAIKAYLLSLPAVHRPSPVTQLSFPFNQRWGIRFWKWFNLQQQQLQPDPQRSAQWNNGRYLVEALAHCGTCHTPRNFMMGMQEDKFLAGGDLGSWVAFNITPDRQAGIGNWSKQQIVTYLKTGYVAGKASVSGAMAEAIEHSLQYLPDSDLEDIATYLQSVPPIADKRQSAARDSWGQPQSSIVSLRGADSSEIETQPGAVIYAGNCASCHGASGGGAGQGLHAYPSLFHHSVIGAYDATNLISVILNGVNRRGQSGQIFMPAFAAGLNDQQIADLTNFVMKNFGNPNAANTTGEQVEKIRSDGHLPSPAVFYDGSEVNN